MKTYSIFLLLFITLQACTSNKPATTSFTFAKDTISYNALSLKQAIQLERTLGSFKDQDSMTKYYMGSGLYPNKKKYELAPALSFHRTGESYFSNKVDYHFDTKDSAVKAVLYEWNSAMDYQKSYTVKQKSQVFRAKFEQLEKEITERIGEPSSVILESKVNSSSYRDDVHWENKRGINIYMFMFGNSNGYRQIRVVVYWE
jgi:hypothetical protein